jgi:hypothetical protein
LFKIYIHHVLLSNLYRVVLGDVNGQLKAVFQKLGALHAKNNFAFVIVVGNLFGDVDVGDGSNQLDVQALLDGKIDIPLPTYFALTKHALPPAVVEKLESSSEELCHNLYFLGRRSVTKTSEGIRIVALGGQLDPNIVAGSSKDKYRSMEKQTQNHSAEHQQPIFSSLATGPRTFVNDRGWSLSPT